jgi:ligand-binding sensor domain-containing protein
MSSGLSRLENGVATEYTGRGGLPGRLIDSVRGDANGSVWAQTSGGLARFGGAKCQAYPQRKVKSIGLEPAPSGL